LPQKALPKSFNEIATEEGTDKVTLHTYQFAYEALLPQFRSKKIRFLEIGLGCGMTYGPGKSFALWDRYFSHVGTKIFFIEYDAECAEKWKGINKRVEIFIGDQSDVNLM
jgi:hypothetical protein